jgi:hypothetical protein
MSRCVLRGGWSPVVLDGGCDSVRSAIQRRTRHTEIPRDLRRRRTTVDKLDCTSDLAVRYALRPAFEVVARRTPFVYGVNSYAFDFMLICARAAIIVNNIELIGVEVFTSPPPKFRTR